MLYEKKDPVHPLSLSRERTILELPREQTLVRTQNITRFALLATLRQIIAYCKHLGRQLSFLIASARIHAAHVSVDVSLEDLPCRTRLLLYRAALRAGNSEG